ncbi:MAG: nodulation protein [Proteobacteria bacterium]|nr:nodulation protein [Pseudomonadota bacterium]
MGAYLLLRHWDSLQDDRPCYPASPATTVCTLYILGISGSPFLAQDPVSFDQSWWHDSAAVLLKDGAIVAAIEEERLSRDKHTSRFPQRAVVACLAEAGIGIGDVDCVSYYTGERHARGALTAVSMANPRMVDTDPTSVLRDSLARSTGTAYRGRLDLVKHHLAHVASAHHLSGWSDCLVFTTDGRGDQESGMVIDVRGNRWESLLDLPIADSLGMFYERMIRFIGYGSFEEYKVMSLASYGDPATYRKLFQGLYRLLPEGRFSIEQNWDSTVVYDHFQPRRRHEPITRKDMDYAAALQEALEDMAGHLLAHYRQRTGQRRLAMAGGVALNCAMTGKLLVRGVFDEVFVQPASNDAGCALGAALYTAAQGSLPATPQMEHCYWGPALPPTDEVERIVGRWQDVVTARRIGDSFDEAAGLLEGGAIMGWAQGRMEFGPRALGNRSIVADSRFASATKRINSVIKKRDNFQPFAPSVLEEELHTFFELPAHVRTLPFMVFTANVRPEWRDKLGAITHVDGTARVQTVSKRHNPRYWSLIRALGDRTGVPMVLNTSFNNQAEPIVSSVEDALACFVSTDLDHLVVGDFLVSKRADTLEPLWNWKVALRPVFQLWHRPGPPPAWEIRQTSFPTVRPISAEAYRLLAAPGDGTVAERAAANGLVAHKAALLEELMALWNSRIVGLSPA